MKKLLVVELDGMRDILEECKANNWEAVFTQTQSYKSWLPIDDIVKEASVIEKSELSFLDIIKLAEKVNIQSILPVSLLEPECVRDALVKDYIDSHKLPFRILANSPSTVELCYDKWLTKEIFLKMNLPVVPGNIIESNKQLSGFLKKKSFPVIIKQRKNFTGQGMRIIKDPEAFQNYIEKYDVKDLLVEPFLEGSEISLEVISWKNEKVFQPLVYKGETRLKIYEHPAYRPRISPWKKKSELESIIQLIAGKAIDLLNLKGAVEFEFIVLNNQPLLLEINPRISGVSRLCLASGGVNAFRLLTHIAIKDTIGGYNQKITPEYAIQLPLTILPEGDLLAEFKNHPNITYIKPITWMPLLPIKSNVVLSYRSVDELNAGVDTFMKYTNENYISEAKSTINKFF